MTIQQMLILGRATDDGRILEDGGIEFELTGRDEGQDSDWKYLVRGSKKLASVRVFRGDLVMVDGLPDFSESRAVVVAHKYKVLR